MANINEFKARIAGGGARANQFRIILPPPVGAEVTAAINTEQFAFLCTAASLPGQTIAETEVKFRGRNLYLAGERTFETWSTTVLNDTDFSIRREMERWMNGINDTVNNTGATSPDSYRVDMIVQQLDRDDTILHQYILEGCWPTVIAPIELSYATENEVETFEITWRYDTFRVSGINL